MSGKIGKKFIDPEMTDDLELAQEALARSQGDGTLQGLINQLQSNKYDASNPNGYETPAQLNTRDTNNRDRMNHTGTQSASTISNFSSAVLSTVLTGLSTGVAAAITATDSVLSALGKLQATLSAHIGSGDTSHAAVTQTVNGFMIASDKVKLDNALGRIVYPLISAPTAAANTVYTSVGTQYSWVQARNPLIKSGVIVFYATITTRNFQIRVVNLDTGAVLGTSAIISISGLNVLPITLPTTDCRIGIQILKSASGGTSPTVDACQIGFETI